jgi:hypothetical protein
MAENKTKATGEDVVAFIHEFANTEQKVLDSLELVKLMEEATGEKAHMWGPSIVGFGSYHYKYASGHEGDAPRLGFSPRKAAISLYVFSGLEKHKPILANLGKFKMGKACIYVNKLSDINIDELKKVMKATLDWLDKTYPKNN